MVDGKLKGGIEDLGNFKEGFCFRLRLKTSAIWNICSDIMQEKIIWIKKL